MVMFHNKFLNKRNSILIAGCGTGKEPAEYGQLIKDVDITAVDLSSKSLGYAIRKCNELKIDNINFLQARDLSSKWPQTLEFNHRLDASRKQGSFESICLK